MDPYTTDDETVENLRRWWKENGPWIIGGIALGAAVLYGWRYWAEWRETQLTFASDTYEQLIVESANADYVHALELAREIRDVRLSTPYADMAALYVARNAVISGDIDVAVAQLRDVIETTDDADTAHLARLRLARVHLAAGDLDAAAALVTRDDTGRYAPMYGELRGDIAAGRGDTDAAIAAYRDAMAAPGDGIADRAMLQMKLDNLGAGTPAQGA
ncbi:MAG: tetratricopeptide repeat protein [Gammaproteobacteria bacterium]